MCTNTMVFFPSPRRSLPSLALRHFVQPPLPPPVPGPGGPDLPPQAAPAHLLRVLQAEVREPTQGGHAGEVQGGGGAEEPAVREELPGLLEVSLTPLIC